LQKKNSKRVNSLIHPPVINWTGLQNFWLTPFGLTRSESTY